MLVFAVTAQCCNGSSADNSTSEKEVLSENQDTSQVKVYYFHATRRCATCNAVEETTKEALAEYYGDKVSFESINREEEKDNALVKQYEISGSTLLIINGDKKVDLTNDGFLNARTNPEKFKSKLKSTIDSLI
jgi:hypothetical protein